MPKGLRIVRHVAFSVSAGHYQDIALRFPINGRVGRSTGNAWVAMMALCVSCEVERDSFRSAGLAAEQYQQRYCGSRGLFRANRRSLAAGREETRQIAVQPEPLAIVKRCVFRNEWNV